MTPPLCGPCGRNSSAVWRGIRHVTSGLTAAWGRRQRSLRISGPFFSHLNWFKSCPRRARGILRREVPRRKEAEPGQVTQRFLGAVTHRGKLCLYDSALIQCGRVYELADGCDLAHELLLPVLTGATALGWDVIACPQSHGPSTTGPLVATPAWAWPSCPQAGTFPCQ